MRLVFLNKLIPRAITMDSNGGVNLSGNDPSVSEEVREFKSDML